MSFHSVRFPEDISFGAISSLELPTQIVVLANGQEERNQNWKRMRRKYSAGSGIKSLDELYDVISFFEARRAMLHSFRWKDWADYKSCKPLGVVDAYDQIIGHGDGVSMRYQLQKTYFSSDFRQARDITKPLKGSVTVVVDDMPMRDGSNYEVNFDTGIITFSKPPSAGAPIRAGFEFDVPVRFDVSNLSVTLTHFDAGECPDIPVIEVFE